MVRAWVPATAPNSAQVEGAIHRDSDGSMADLTSPNQMKFLRIRIRRGFALCLRVCFSSAVAFPLSAGTWQCAGERAFYMSLLGTFAVSPYLVEKG